MNPYEFDQILKSATLAARPMLGNLSYEDKKKVVRPSPNFSPDVTELQVKLAGAMFHDAPEVTPTTGPHAYHQPSEVYHQPDKPALRSNHHEPHEDHTPLPPKVVGRRPARKSVLINGCMAVLVAAVIGLAVATGLGMKRASEAELRATTAEKRAAIAEDQLSTRVDSTTAGNGTTLPSSEGPTDASLGAIDKGCSSTPDMVNNSLYMTQVGKKTFRILCNADAANKPLLALLVSDFDHCMYACASYTRDMPAFFPDDEERNATCSGVSFIPSWTGWEEIIAAKSRGNCYLKQGPMNADTSYKTPSGASTHSAYAV